MCLSKMKGTKKSLKEQIKFELEALHIKRRLSQR